METLVRDLMTSPAVTCTADDSLTAAASTMQGAETGSVVVTDDGKVVGILTERDLLRAAAGAGDLDRERVRLFMTANPDVLGPDERVDAAWASLTSHHYRHLPVVEDGRCVGVVSLRDLMGVARIRPAGETSMDVPAGLEGVVVAETTVGDVRGQEGFFHYRQYSAVELAETRSLEDVWHLLFRGELPDAAASAAFGELVRHRRTLPAGLHTLLPALSSGVRRSRSCARRYRCWGRNWVGARPTTSTPTSSTSRRSGCAPWCRPSSPRRTGWGTARSRSSPEATSARRPTTSTC